MLSHLSPFNKGDYGVENVSRNKACRIKISEEMKIYISTTKI